MQLEEDESDLDPWILKIGGKLDKFTSHSVVGRAAAALGADPVDVLLVVFDITRLAVDAVLSVDDQPLAVDAVLARNVLVDAWNGKDEKIFNANAKQDDSSSMGIKQK